MLSQLLKSSGQSISFVGSSFADTAGSVLNSYSQSVPSGFFNDMLVLICGNNNGVTYTTPSGWTSLASSTRSAIFYKSATSASEANFTVSTSGIAIQGGVVLRFRDATKAPVAGTVATATIAGPSTITATAVSATFNDYVLQIVVDGGSSRTFSQPSVSTGTLFVDSNAFQPSIAVFYQLNGSNDATTTKTGASSVDNFVQVRLRA